jgi:hypothetical protein
LEVLRRENELLKRTIGSAEASVAELESALVESGLELPETSVEGERWIKFAGSQPVYTLDIDAHFVSQWYLVFRATLGLVARNHLLRSFVPAVLVVAKILELRDPQYILPCPPLLNVAW